MAIELSPTDSANLALQVYDVNAGNSYALKAFLHNKLFSQNNEKNVLKAEVGGRLLRAAQDSFGVCAHGAGNYQGDLFLIFRGTTKENNKADFVTDARIGITFSKTGSPVHIGFNHTFNSMLPQIRTFLAEAKVTGRVHCIGHSLGGAIASLAADWVSRNTNLPTKLYTFGAPRVGTEWFSSATTRALGPRNIYRVYHETDPVAMVALYPFMHAPYRQNGCYIHSSEPLMSRDAHLMNKVAVHTLVSIQSSFIGAFTLADKIAYILAKGIDLADNVSIWVEHLMRKLMSALGMKAASSKKELTRDLIRQVLIRVTQKANDDARNALRKL